MKRIYNEQFIKISTDHEKYVLFLNLQDLEIATFNDLEVNLFTNSRKITLRLSREEGGYFGILRNFLTEQEIEETDFTGKQEIFHYSFDGDILLCGESIKTPEKKKGK